MIKNVAWTTGQVYKGGMEAEPSRRPLENQCREASQTSNLTHPYSPPPEKTLDLDQSQEPHLAKVGWTYVFPSPPRGDAPASIAFKQSLKLFGYNSFIHSFIHSFIYSFIRPSTTNPPTHPSIHACIHPSIHPFIHSFIHSVADSEPMHSR